MLKGRELFWVENTVELFFLQIQGSGRIELPDGKQVKVGYADQNGYPYVSIGKKLVEMGSFWNQLFQKGHSNASLSMLVACTTKDIPEVDKILKIAKPCQHTQLRTAKSAWRRGNRAIVDSALK